jgi:hypothetical protein
MATLRRGPSSDDELAGGYRQSSLSEASQDAEHGAGL